MTDNPGDDQIGFDYEPVPRPPPRRRNDSVWIVPAIVLAAFAVGGFALWRSNASSGGGASNPPTSQAVAPTTATVVEAPPVTPALVASLRPTCNACRKVQADIDAGVALEPLTADITRASDQLDLWLATASEADKGSELARRLVDCRRGFQMSLAGRKLLTTVEDEAVSDPAAARETFQKGLKLRTDGNLIASTELAEVEKIMESPSQ